MIPDPKDASSARPGCFDVAALGAVAIDDFLFVETFPPPDGKARVLRRDRQCGGLAGAALVAAARFGCRCAYYGVVGEDELSNCVLTALSQEGIDVSSAGRRPGAGPVHSHIIVDEARATRAVLFDLSRAIGADPDHLRRPWIERTRVLLLDHLGVPGMLVAAQWARARNIPLVADFEEDGHPDFSLLISTVDHLVLSRDFGTRLTGCSDPAKAARALWNRQTVVITCGSEGGWFCAPDFPDPQRYAAFQVAVSDTTGCGDVFHGAYAATLALGLDLPERLQWAAAAAALKAGRGAGFAGIPSRAEIEEFLHIQEAHNA